MSYRQFQDWLTLYRVEPFGDVRDDLRMARIAAHAGRVSNESKLLFRWKYLSAPRTPEEYQQKAMNAWGNAGGGLRLSKADNGTAGQTP